MNLTRNFFIISLSLIFFNCRNTNNPSDQNVENKPVVDCAVDRKNFIGNKIFERVPYSDGFFLDPIDDNINFRIFTDSIYVDKEGKVYVRNTSGAGIECKMFYEFFKDVTEFVDTLSYKKIRGNYFANKSKIYMWWANSGGSFAVEIKGADPTTFQPFDEVCGGKDNKRVFYGSAVDGINIIKGANASTLKTLNPADGCWDCGNCYFVDDKNVFCGTKIIPNADPMTFILSEKNNIDATDKNNQYYKGQIVK